MGCDLYTCDFCGEAATEYDIKNLEEMREEDEDFDVEKYGELFETYHEAYGCNSQPDLWCGCQSQNWFTLHNKIEKNEEYRAQNKEIEALKERVIELEALLEAKTKKSTKKAGPKEPPKYKRITIEQYDEYQTLKK